MFFMFRNVVLILFFTLFMPFSLSAQQTAENYPPDVSFMIIDLKYKDEKIKICELGEGLVSGFVGYEKLYGRGSMYKNFSRFLSSLGRPVCTLDLKKLSAFQKEAKLLFKRSNQTGSSRLFSIENAVRSSHQANRFDQKTNRSIIVPTLPYRFLKYSDLVKQLYPKMIIIDQTVRPFVLNKLFTHLLCMNDPILGPLRPHCKIVPKQYSPKLAQEIINQFKCENFVIKPLNAWKGRGIVMVNKGELDSTLEMIIDQPTMAQKSPNKALRYWAHNRHEIFLVESLESSNLVTVEGAEYDATMRVALGVYYEEGKVKVQILGAYWKLPSKSVTQNCSLTEKYKSHIQPNTTCSARVAIKDLITIEKILNRTVPTLYKKMLHARYDINYLPNLITSHQLCPEVMQYFKNRSASIYNSWAVDLHEQADA